MPSVKGLRGLDTGCGEGTNTAKLAHRGAIIDAIDIAPSFVRATEQRAQDEGLAITVIEADAAQLPFAEAHFDFVTAFMSMMDVADAEAVFSEAFRVTKAGGFFQLSILHPCFAAYGSGNIRDDKGQVIGRAIYHYFRQSKGKIEEWMFNSAKTAGETAQFQVPRYDRPLSDWMAIILKKGWQLELLSEPRCTPEKAQKFPRLSADLIHPNFMIMRLRKPAA